MSTVRRSCARNVLQFPENVLRSPVLAGTLNQFTAAHNYATAFDTIAGGATLKLQNRFALLLSSALQTARFLIAVSSLTTQSAMCASAANKLVDCCLTVGFLRAQKYNPYSCGSTMLDGGNNFQWFARRCAVSLLTALLACSRRPKDRAGPTADTLCTATVNVDADPQVSAPNSQVALLASISRLPTRTVPVPVPAPSPVSVLAVVFASGVGQRSRGRRRGLFVREVRRRAAGLAAGRARALRRWHARPARILHRQLPWYGLLRKWREQRAADVCISCD